MIPPNTDHFSAVSIFVEFYHNVDVGPEYMLGNPNSFYLQNVMDITLLLCTFTHVINLVHEVNDPTRRIYGSSKMVRVSCQTILST